MEQEDAAETVKTRGNESFIILTGLEGNTLYHFTVRAYNGAGYGPPSSEVSATTKKSRKCPGLLFVSDKKETYFHISESHVRYIISRVKGGFDS